MTAKRIGMKDFDVVLASGAEHLRRGFETLGFRVFSSESNHDGKRFFPNSDLYTRINDVAKMSNRRVVVIQSGTGSSPSERELFSTSDRVQELVMLLDILKHPVDVKKLKHKEYRTKPIQPPNRVEVVLTFQPFALQDKAFKTGEAVSCRIAMQEISRLCDKVWLVEPVVGKSIPWVKELSDSGLCEEIAFAEEIVKFAAKRFGFTEYFLIAPDEGSQKRFGIPGFKKRRTDSFTIEMYGELDVKDQNVIVIDDLTKSGTTLLRAGERLKAQGAIDVGRVVLHVTPVAKNGEDLLQNLVTKSGNSIIVSNSVYSSTFCESYPDLTFNIVDKLVESLTSK
ncbi:MAG: phosphoribosyltransferase family protein [Candidatus Thorarchaeota archaeon]